MTRSPAIASRAAARERIFSATVLSNDPLPEEDVELVHRQWARIGQGLDPPRDLLELILAELEPELARAMADRVFARQTVRDVDRPREAEVGGIQDLVAVRVEVDRLRVHPRLVVERVLAGHEVVVRDLDADERRDELVQLAELRQVVLPADRGRVVGVHPRDEAPERRDAV